MFELVCELFGHQGDIRGLAALPEGKFVSGSRDRIAKIWRAVRDGRGYEELAALLEHQHWVSVVTRLPGDLGFVTGCQDNKIRWYGLDGSIKGTLTGHQGPVSSLAWDASKEVLVSGSWDETARIWNLGSGECLNVLSGHENGVCVLPLPNGVIVTGSSGVQNNNRVEGFQLRLWRDGKEFASLKEHQGAIRSLCLAAEDGSTFASTSNDGTVRVWSAESGTLLATMSNPMGPEGSPSFNFCVAPLNNYSRLVVACDDCCVRVWNAETGEQEEEIAHPCTVWCVTQLDNGDLVTGGSDGVARVFSTSSERHAPSEVREGYLNEALRTREAIANKASNGGQKIDPNKLAKIYEAQPGSSDNEVKMFNKDGQAWVYSWSASSQTWIEVGEVMGDAGGGKETIDGVEYDRVIPVEIEDPASGGLRKLKLGFNNEDSPYVVAQQFVAKYELSEGHVQEIADFVQSVRSQSAKTPTIDMSGGGAGASAHGGGGPSGMDIDESSHLAPARDFPLQYSMGMAFDSGDLDKIMKKLEEVNGNSSSPMSDKELSAVHEVCATLKQTSRYHATTVNASGVRAIVRLFDEWDLKEGFAVLDLLRLLLTHPDGSVKVASLKRTVDIMKRALQVASPSGSESAALAPALLGARLVANLFRHSPTADAAAQALVESDSAVTIAEPLQSLTEYPNKNVRNAVATCLLNCSNKLAHMPSVQANTSTRKGLLLAAIQSVEACAQEGAQEKESIRRALLAVGCLLVLKPVVSIEHDRVTDALAPVEPLGFAELSSQIKEVLRKEHK